MPFSRQKRTAKAFFVSHCIRNCTTWTTHSGNCKDRLPSVHGYTTYSTKASKWTKNLGYVWFCMHACTYKCHSLSKILFAEDFVGQQARLSRRVSPITNSLRSLERYLVRARAVWVKALGTERQAKRKMPAARGVASREKMASWSELILRRIFYTRKELSPDPNCNPEFSEPNALSQNLDSKQPTRICPYMRNDRSQANSRVYAVIWC